MRLGKYCSDKSDYFVRPRNVIVARNENDVEGAVEYSKKHRVPLTARAAGSNLCGSALGKGVIVDFTKMNAIVTGRGSTVRVQPGIVYRKLNEAAKTKGFFLPYSPSSADFCTIGGNVSTKASGLRGVKYGSTDNFVKNIRFVNPEYGIVDTSESLPDELEEKIRDIRKRLLADRAACRLLREKTSLKTSSGYHLF